MIENEGDIHFPRKVTKACGFFIAFWLFHNGEKFSEKKTQKNEFFEKVVWNKNCLEWSITYDSEEFWGFMWAQITKNYFYWGKSEVDVKI